MPKYSGYFTGDERALHHGVKVVFGPRISMIAPCSLSLVNYLPTGLKQGGTLAPTLFGIYFSPLLEYAFNGDAEVSFYTLERMESFLTLQD